jgi:formylglycine-generating enzyme required for sulfatase activity
VNSFYPKPGDEHPIYLPLPGGEAGSVKIRFRYIPAGHFRMGIRGDLRWEEPVHTVRISEGFYFAQTPVTQEQFSAWIGSDFHKFWLEEFPHLRGSLNHRYRFPGNMNGPAERMNWHEAVAFCDWINCHELIARQMPPGFAKCGLPSEAQWEYACRGPNQPDEGMVGHQCDYNVGDGRYSLEKAGWFDGNSRQTTQSVGQLQPNGWNLYDMHGNVWEWCFDWWHSFPYVLRPDGAENPLIGDETWGRDQLRRVIRGGAWDFPYDFCRSSSRRWWSEKGSNRNIGFRPMLARSDVSS